MSDPLVALLITEGHLPHATLEDARERQVLHGGSLDSVLLEMGLVDETTALELLGRAYALPTADRARLEHVAPALRALLPRRLAERHHMIPLELTGRRLVVATTSPPDIEALDELGFTLSLYLKPVLTTETRVAWALARHYAVALPARFQSILKHLGEDLIPDTGPADPSGWKARVPTPSPSRPALGLSTIGDRDTSGWEVAARGARPFDVAAPTTAELSGTEGGSFAARDIVAEERVREHMARVEDEEQRVEQRRRERVLWTVDDAIAELALADDRDALLEVALRFAYRRLSTAAVFVHLHNGWVCWDIIDPLLSARDLRPFRIADDSLNGEHLLGQLARTTSPMIGPLGADDPLHRLLGRRPRAVLLAPVLVGDHVVAAIVGDNGARSIPPAALAELHMLTPRLGKALGNLILRAKRGLRPDQAPTTLPPTTLPPTTLPPTTLPPTTLPLATTPAGPPAGTQDADREEGEEDVVLDDAFLRDLDSPKTPAAAAIMTPTGTGAPPPLAVPLLATAAAVAVAVAPPARPPPAPIAAPPAEVDESLLATPMLPLMAALPRSIPRPLSQKLRTPTPMPREHETLSIQIDDADLFQDALAAVDDVVKRALADARPRADGDTPSASEGSAGIPSSPGARARESLLLATWRDWRALVDDEADALVAALQAAGDTGTAAQQSLLAMGDRALPALGRGFPGALRANPLSTPALLLPPLVSELVALLARLGADQAAPVLVGELEHVDRSHRAAATWTLATVLVPAALPRLQSRVFDAEPQIATLAVTVLEHYRKSPGFFAVLEKLRDLVRRGDDFEKARAISAVAALRDTGAVTVLIDVLNAPPRAIAQAAHLALVEITRQDFGLAERRWRAWFADHEHESRLRWLVEALAHEDVNIRRATFDELANTTGETFGYRHDASTTERAQAVEAWKTWLTHAESDSRPKAST